MRYIAYDILLHLCMIVLIPYYIAKMIFAGKYRHGLPERFAVYGRGGPTPAAGDTETLWFHAVSVGETRAVMPLLRRFKEAHPKTRIVFSTVTETGRELAKSEGAALIDSLIYMPLDLSWVVKRALKRIRPSLFVIVEKEYWPNIIRLTRASGVPVMVVNATVSRRSFTRYKKLSFFFREIFNGLSLFCAKREEDGARIRELGMDGADIRVVGNLKFDMEEVNASREIAGLRDSLGVTQDDTVIVAGSTHKGEEEIIIETYKKLKKDFPGLKLLIAPRHPNRFDEVALIIEEAGLKTNRRSQCAGGKEGVILLDTVGELFMAYAISSVSFVGGSLVPIGGHNLLEPAFHSSPVLYGPNIGTCRDMGDLLEEAGGSIMVSGKDSLYDTLDKLLREPAAHEPQWASQGKRSARSEQGRDGKDHRDDRRDLAAL